MAEFDFDKEMNAILLKQDSLKHHIAALKMARGDDKQVQILSRLARNAAYSLWNNLATVAGKFNG